MPISPIDLNTYTTPAVAAVQPVSAGASNLVQASVATTNSSLLQTVQNAAISYNDPYAMLQELNTGNGLSWYQEQQLLNPSANNVSVSQMMKNIVAMQQQNISMLQELGNNNNLATVNGNTLQQFVNNATAIQNNYSTIIQSLMQTSNNNNNQMIQNLQVLNSNYSGNQLFQNMVGSNLINNNSSYQMLQNLLGLNSNYNSNSTSQSSQTGTNYNLALLTYQMQMNVQNNLFSNLYVPSYNFNNLFG